MVLGFTYGKFPEVENRRRQHRGRMPLADAIHEVIEVAHPTGRDHRHRDAIRYGLGQRNVETLPGSVPVHGRQQDFTGAERDHFLGIFDRVDACGITAAMGKDFPALAAAAALDALGVDRDHDALIAEFFGRFLDEFAAADGGAVDRHLVGAGSQQHANIVDGAHTAADRQRHEAGFRGAPDHIQHGAAVFVGGGNIEKAQLIGAGGVIGDRRFHGIAGVAQIDKVDALDDPAVLDVETGDHADFKHYSAADSKARGLRKSQNTPSMRPSYSDELTSTMKNRLEPENFNSLPDKSDTERLLFKKQTCPSRVYISAPLSSEST